MLPRAIRPTALIATAWRPCLLPASVPTRCEASLLAVKTTFIPSASTSPFILFAASYASSSSSRWLTRQSSDPYTRSSKLAGLKSRAAYKLLEINTKYPLFSRGDTVVDLGYAPGSWSQVAVNRVGPEGRVVGIDVIPVQPPKGVSTLQGDFLSESIRHELRKFVRDAKKGRSMTDGEGGVLGAILAEEKGEEKSVGSELGNGVDSDGDEHTLSQDEKDMRHGRVVNVVLSDMCEPWPLANSTWIKSVSNPYFRMMNTSGMAFRDHAGSMDLCLAALEFCYDTLVTDGNFLCKFYQGSEDRALEMRLKQLFEKVHRIKPDSSRKESREAYLVGLKRKADIPREVVLGNG